MESSAATLKKNKKLPKPSSLLRQIVRRFLQNKMSLIGLAFLIFIILLSFIGPFFRRI